MVDFPQKLIIENSSDKDLIFFLRGDPLSNINNLGDYTIKNYKNKILKGTAVFSLKKNVKITLNIIDEIANCVIWFTPSEQANYNSNLIGMGPQDQSVFEFTISNAIFTDISCVDGFTNNMIIQYLDKNSKVKVSREANPKKIPFNLLKRIEDKSLDGNPNNNGFITLTADKYDKTLSPEEKNLAAGACANDLWGTWMNRKWYYKQNQNPQTYCGWFKKYKIAAYCWQNDEEICTSEDCGYSKQNDNWPDSPNDIDIETLCPDKTTTNLKEKCFNNTVPGYQDSFTNCNTTDWSENKKAIDRAFCYSKKKPKTDIRSCKFPSLGCGLGDIPVIINGKKYWGKGNEGCKENHMVELNTGIEEGGKIYLQILDSVFLKKENEIDPKYVYCETGKCVREDGKLKCVSEHPDTPDTPDTPDDCGDGKFSCKSSCCSNNQFCIFGKCIYKNCFKIMVSVVVIIILIILIIAFY